MMVGTRIPNSQLVSDQRQEQRRLEKLLDAMPLCFHYPVASHKDTCVRCATHNRCDELDGDIAALLRSPS